MREQRQFKRRHLMLHLRVFRADDGSYLGNLSNISTHGVMITGDDPLALEQRYELLMRLPMPVRGHERLKFTARVAWTSHDMDSAYYDCGMEFIDIDPHKQEILQQLIDDYGLSDD